MFTTGDNTSTITDDGSGSTWEVDLYKSEIISQATWNPSSYSSNTTTLQLNFRADTCRVRGDFGNTEIDYTGDGVIVVQTGYVETHFASFDGGFPANEWHMNDFSIRVDIWATFGDASNPDQYSHLYAGNGTFQTQYFTFKATDGGGDNTIFADSAHFNISKKWEVEPGNSLSMGNSTVDFNPNVNVYSNGTSFANVYCDNSGHIKLHDSMHVTGNMILTAGGVDFNGNNLGVDGDFTISNGDSTTFANLAGRTISIGGNASFTGQSGNLLNLDADSTWYINTTGSLTASYANIKNSDASGGSTGIGDTTAVDVSGNINWDFEKFWDGGGGDNNWSTAGNWSGDAVPTANSKPIFTSLSTKNAVLDISDTISRISFDANYTGTFDFGTNSLSFTGDTIDFRKGGDSTTLNWSSGAGVYFTGSIQQYLHPMDSTPLPSLHQNNSTGLQILSNGLWTDTLSQSVGTLHLGSGLIHRVMTTLESTLNGGIIDFGGCTVEMYGSGIFSGLDSVEAGTGKMILHGGSTFKPLSGVKMPHVVVESNTALQTALTTDSLTINQNLDFYQSQTHSIGNLIDNHGMDLKQSTLEISEDATFNAGFDFGEKAQLNFIGDSIQNLTPPSDTLAPITLTGNGTLTLQTNDLTTHSFSQTAGSFNFNGQELTAVQSILISGTGSNVLQNLGGRTLTSGGNIILEGTASQPIVVEPASTWYVNSGGQLTGRHISLKNSDASGGVWGDAYNYQNQGGNVNWRFYGNDPSHFSHGRFFTFNTTSSGADVPGNVTDIPILLRLNENNFNFASIREDRTDLMVLDPSGKKLFYETAWWDESNKSAGLWIRVPQVDGNSTTDGITLYSGCSTCDIAWYENSDSVWSDYGGVWHLNGYLSNAPDASGNDNTGTLAQSMASAEGLVSQTALRFNRSGDYIDVSPAASIDNIFSTGGTLLSWIFPESDDSLGRVASKRWELYTHSGVLNFGQAFSSTEGQWQASSDPVSYNQWNHVAVVYSAGSDANDPLMYLNGTARTITEAQSPSGTYSNDDARQLRFGDDNGLNRPYHGRLNHLRLIKRELSSDYIKLSYENQRENSLLFSGELNLSDFSGSRKYPFNTSSTGADVSEDVLNFPMLLRITDASIIDAVGPGAPDIRFLDDDGVNWLDYEIERWDQGVDSAEVWVKVPQVDGNSTTDFITLYYGHSELSDAQCGGCVFDTTNGHILTWHLNESANTTADGYQDATHNAHHGTGQSMSNASAEGIINKAAGFDGIDDIILDDDGQNYLNGRDSITISFWMKPDTTGLDMGVYAGVDSGSGDNHVTFRYDKLAGSGTEQTYKLSLQSSGGAVEGPDSLQSLEWQHWTIAWKTGDSIFVYLNGEKTLPSSGGTQAGTLTGNTQFALGHGGLGDYYKGSFDELRVEGVRRSASWVKLAYESQRPNPTIWNGAPQNFTGSKRISFNTTSSGANVAEDVTDFPMLVRIYDASIVDGVRSGAPDIRFLDKDGITWLDYEIERWDQSADSAEVWVKVPQVDGGSASDYITLYYGHSSLGDGQCPECVFDTTNGHILNWHLNETANTSADGYKDVTSNTHHGTGQSMSLSETKGIIGSAAQFDGSDDFILDDDGENYLNGRDSLTFSFWMKSEQTNVDMGLLSGTDQTGGDNFVSFRYDRVGAGAGSQETFKLNFETTGGNNQIEGPDSIQSLEWQHWVCTWKTGDSAVTYLNGKKLLHSQSDIPNGSLTGNTKFALGHASKDAY